MKVKLIFIPLIVLSLGLFSFIGIGTSLAWEKTVHDFGQIDKNKPVTAKFTFKNTGDAPLILTRVKGSCGCTITEYTKGEIPAGEWGMVKATYNAARVGAFNKTVQVTANTGEGPMILRIKGEVVE